MCLVIFFSSFFLKKQVLLCSSVWPQHRSSYLCFQSARIKETCYHEQLFISTHIYLYNNLLLEQHPSKWEAWTITAGLGYKIVKQKVFWTIQPAILEYLRSTSLRCDLLRYPFTVPIMKCVYEQNYHNQDTECWSLPPSFFGFPCRKSLLSQLLGYTDLPACHQRVALLPEFCRVISVVLWLASVTLGRMAAIVHHVSGCGKTSTFRFQVVLNGVDAP